MKCSKNNLIKVVSWSVAVGVLLLVSCSGTAVSPLGEGVEADQDDMGYAQAFLENGTIVMQSPPSPRAAAEQAEQIDDSIMEEYDPMHDLLFSLAHIPLVSGENEVDYLDYLYHSEDVFVDHDDFFSYVVLRSEVGGMSFVTYGFRDIPEGENITRVEVLGEGYFGDGPSNGIYLGIGDPEADTYEWVGPFKNGEEWAINTPFMDNTNDQQRAYLTIAVAGGDEAGFRGLTVYVDGMPVVDVDDIIPEELLDPFPGPLPDPLPDWLLDELGPEL